MDIYFEQSLLNENIDKHLRRTNFLGILRYVLLFLAGIIAVICFILPLDENNIKQSVIANLVILVVLCVPLVLSFFFIGKYINTSNLEYDYILNGKSFKIIKIMNRKKRKLLLDLSIDCFESLGAVRSEAYGRYTANRETKMHYAITNVKNEQDIFYIYYITEGEKHLLHFAPNHEMMISLRKCLPRITVFDKSFQFNETLKGVL